MPIPAFTIAPPPTTVPPTERPVVGRAPYAPEALLPDNDDAAPNPASVVFNFPRARAIELDQQPSLYTKIDVYGEREARPSRVKSFEQRFSEALNPHGPSGYPRDWGANAKPCVAFPSQGTGVGTTFNVYGYCP